MNVQPLVNRQPAVEDLKPLILRPATTFHTLVVSTKAGPEAREWPIRRLLSQSQTAAYLGVSGRTVFKLARKGLLKRVRIGGSIRYDLVDITCLILNNKQS